MSAFILCTLHSCESHPFKHTATTTTSLFSHFNSIKVYCFIESGPKILTSTFHIQSTWQLHAHTWMWINWKHRTDTGQRKRIYRQNTKLESHLNYIRNEHTVPVTKRTPPFTSMACGPATACVKLRNLASSTRLYFKWQVETYRMIRLQ